jgi:hypothetical protein
MLDLIEHSGLGFHKSAYRRYDEDTYDEWEGFMFLVFPYTNHVQPSLLWDFPVIRPL